MDYLAERNQMQPREINCANYARVIFKRRKIIFAFFILGLAAAIITSFVMFKANQRKQIQVESIIEISSIESAAVVAEKIKMGTYDNFKGIGAETTPDTNLVKTSIILEDRGGVEAAEKKLNDLAEFIIVLHREKTEELKGKLAARIAAMEKDLNFLISRNQQIITLQMKIYELKRELDEFRPTKLVGSPVIDELPGRFENLNIGLNIVLGGLLGLFSGVCLAFGKEWWDKNKETIKAD